MDKADVRKAKAEILHCLTEDFAYGTRKDGTPLKRPHTNQRLFDAQEGHAVFHGTDLTMVMDAVVLGLYRAMDKGRSDG